MQNYVQLLPIKDLVLLLLSQRYSIGLLVLIQIAKVRAAKDSTRQRYRAATSMSVEILKTSGAIMLWIHIEIYNRMQWRLLASLLNESELICGLESRTSTTIEEHKSE